MIKDLQDKDRIREIVELIKVKNSTNVIELDTGEVNAKGNPIIKTTKPFFAPSDIAEELGMPYTELLDYINYANDNELDREWKKYTDKFMNRRYEIAKEANDTKTMFHIENEHFKVFAKQNSIPDITFIINQSKDKADDYNELIEGEL